MSSLLAKSSADRVTSGRSSTPITQILRSTVWYFPLHVLLDVPFLWANHFLNRATDFQLTSLRFPEMIGKSNYIYYNEQDIIRLLIDSQTSTVKPLKFGNGYVISSQFYWVCVHLSKLGLSMVYILSSQWRHYGHHGVSNHQPRECLLNCLIRRRSKIKENTKAPRHWPLCGEFTGDRWIPRTNGQ